MALTLFTDIRKLVSCVPLVSAQPQSRLNQSHLGVIDDAAILVETSGAIRWVGPRQDAPRIKAAKSKLSCELVLPGFVDAHTHLLFAGERADEFRRRAAGASYQEIAAEGGGILKTVEATRKASAHELLRLGLERLKTSLSFGVTTIEIKSGYALSLDGEKKLLTVATQLKKKSRQKIIRTYLGAHAFPKDISPDDYMDFLERSTVEWHKKNLYDHLDMFTEEGYYTNKQSERLIQAARTNNIPFKIHADEFSDSGASRLGLHYGALSVDHLLHTLQSSDRNETLALFKRRATVPVFLPGTAFFLKLPYAKPLPFIEAGIPVALATDFNPGSCMSQNISLMMTLAVLNMGMNVEEALAATTIQAAKALGLSDVGALVAGRQADFQVYDCDYGHLVYEFGRAIVRNVYIKGKKAL